MKNNIFTKEVVGALEIRVNALTKETKQKWGKMSVGQMLAHCNVSYEMVFESIHTKPNVFLKFILKTLVKSKVVSDKPYSKNGTTAPQFLIKEAKDFDLEKERLLAYLHKTEQLGEDHFDGKESFSFGPLSKEEWNNLFYKHINHHLEQFGV